MRRVCLVGAGVIAQTHAEALSALPGLIVAAVVDPDRTAAERLARAHGIAKVFASTEELLAEGAFDAAHVLVPPQAHAAVAGRLLAAGKAVLVEKPMAATVAECAALEDLAQAGGGRLGVNQNYVFHPAFLRLRDLLASGRFGLPRSIACTYAAPLRQLAARQFGHWMFHRPLNLLLEQAVHPLSQILSLAGPVRDLRALAGPGEEIAPGVPFIPAVDVTLGCADLPAQLSFAVGRSFPVWTLSVTCDDGVLTADMLGNRLQVQGRTRWIDPIDNLATGARLAAAMLSDSAANLARYGLATLRIGGRRDTFFRSMRSSIAAFHVSDARRGPAYPCDGAFGRALVETCERIGAEAFPPAAPRPTPSIRPPPEPAEVAVVGGTGFIGSAVVRQLLARGRRVAVLARNTTNLPALFGEPGVRVVRCDIRDGAALREAIGRTPLVVNLAHGGGGATYAAIHAAMVGGAATVAQACLDAGVRRLVHVSSIAALYCGPDAGTIDASTPPDPLADQRADYARAKAECDRMLLDMHARQGLPLVIERPGLVVGQGTAPLHSGLGFCNTDQHCIGWNSGRNPLPFVLVEDVAAAIIGALDAEGIEGRCYNLVGDVRPSARDYIARLAATTGRSLQFHPKTPTLLWAEECAKWLIKRLGGRRAPLPSRRDLLSRGLVAGFDCSDAKQDLAWHPCAEVDEFYRAAFG